MVLQRILIKNRYICVPGLLPDAPELRIDGFVKDNRYICVPGLLPDAPELRIEGFVKDHSVTLPMMSSRSDAMREVTSE